MNEIRGKGRDQGILHSFRSKMLEWQLLCEIVIQSMATECL